MLAQGNPPADFGVVIGLFIVFLAFIAGLAGIIAGWIINGIRRK